MPRWSPSAVVCACIDIGSNTTRLLVGECAGATVRPLIQERAFTWLGAGSPVDAATADAVIAALRAQAARARGAGAARMRIVATAGLRRAPGADALVAELAAAAGAPVGVLSEQEEAALAFRGATAALSRKDGPVAVLDVGGGSSEVAVGEPGAPPRWWASVPLGSAVVHRVCGGDPPGPAALARAREQIETAW